MSPVLPIISIVVPAFNAEAYIERCINSCLSQDITVPLKLLFVTMLLRINFFYSQISHGSIDFIHLISNPINSV